MIKLEINGKSVECESGAMIIEAADNANIYIPRFCYHKKLSIAANCRMCLVEVEKSPKPLPACATPVNDGMKVFTQSAKAIEAQKYVMEFLLINHPLDCPICDQGGECELQDISMGFGADHSNYEEPKRAVHDEDMGPLIATDLTRCIQCTRCVRFSQEIAGVPELGLIDRGEDSKIATYVKETLKSELSGNIIDLCPVGALTSKPFRFKARAWELMQTPNIAAHDCVGSNIYMHLRRGEILRVVPKDNEKLNETWISDRDRFSYLGLQHSDRVQKPMIKHQEQWQETDWTRAFEYAAKGLKAILEMHGADQIAALMAPTVTTEEAFLFQKIIRELGSDNIDYRIQQTDFRDDFENNSAPLFQTQIEELSNQECILLIGSNISREQPILSNRVRSSTQSEGRVLVINTLDIEFNFPINVKSIIHPETFVAELAEVAKALNAESQSYTPTKIKQALSIIEPSEIAKTIAAELTKSSNNKIIILGALALNHPQAAELKALARIIGMITGAKIIELTPGANSYGAYIVGATPETDKGLNYQKAAAAKLRAYLLFGIEPEYDCANPGLVQQSLANADFVIAFSAYKSSALEQYADIILPIVPFTETDGSFINAQGDSQAFKAMVASYGEARPGWKVLRVFGNMLELANFQYTNCEEVREDLQTKIRTIDNDNVKIFDTQLTINSSAKSRLTRISEWPLYRIDGIVRRAKALQECGANEKLAARVNPEIAKAHKIKQGDQLQVTQNGHTIMVPVILDTAIPDHCVYVPNGYSETGNLGEAFGEIEISGVQNYI